MKHLNLLLLIFSMSTLFCSCTVTKRHFGNGYHIEWKRKYRESAPEPNTAEEMSRQNYEEESTDLVAYIREPEKPVEVQAQKTDSVSEENNPSLIPQTEEVILRKRSIPSEIKEAPVKTSGNPQRSDNWEEEQKIHPLTWALISVLALGLLSFGLIIVNVFFALGVVGFAFIGMILGIIALASLRRHPEKYRKKRLTNFFAMSLIIPGGIITLFTVVALLYFYL